MRRDLAAPILALLVGGAALAAWAPAAGGEEVHGVALPAGARRLEGDHFASPRGFRDTVEFFRRTLAPRGGDLQPVERVRDVVYARVLARDPAASWSAVHVVLASGRTTIYIVGPGKRPARGSSNGRTTDSGSVYLGSNPSPRTTK